MDSTRLGVTVLAAGASVRMGRPKLLLPWGGSTVLGHLVRVWRELKARQIAVVHGPDSPVFREWDGAERPGVNWVLNAAPDDGMFSSIQAAARWEGWRNDMSHCAIVLGDQPQVAPGLLGDLLVLAGDHPDRIVQPSFAGRPKHPVVLPWQIFRLLRCSSEGRFSEFLEKHSAARVFLESNDPSLAVDLDTPEDYRRARERFDSGQGTSL